MTAAARRGSLNRERVLDAALALVEEAGIEGLSMRGLGARLGVEAMSLYNHVDSKAALLDGLVERLVLEIKLDLRPGEPWPETLRRLAAEYRRLALARPRAFTLLATRPLATTTAVEHVRPLFEILGDAGYSVPDRVLMLNTFFTFLNGFLLAEVGSVPGHADVPDPDNIRVFGQEIEDFGIETFGLAASFDRAVDLVLAGLATLRPS